MKNHFAFLFTVIFAIAGFTACGEDDEGGGSDIVAVASVTLSEPSLIMKQGGKFTLIATVLPEDAADKSVSWSSSDPEVASVDPLTGEVSAIGAGTARVTVKTVDGGFRSACEVTVSEADILRLNPDVTGIVFSWSGNTVYSEGKVIEPYFAVETNVPSWSVEIAPAGWCGYEADDNGFRLVASENHGGTSPEDVTITVSGGEADPVIFTASQKPKVLNVHIVGQEQISSSKVIAKHWKNGEPSDLSGGSSKAYATSLHVTPLGDVYVGGYEGSLGVYWKNGVRTAVTKGDYAAEIRGIYVRDDIVYLCGEYVTPDYPDFDLYVAAYWVGETAYYLGNANDFSSTYDIEVDDKGDIYVAGYLVNGDGYAQAVCWKNGQPSYLSADDTYAFAESLTIADGSVYAAGYAEIIGEANLAGVCWKDGVEIYSILDPAGDIYVFDVFVQGGDVYLAGRLGYDAAYWKNGNLVKLTEGRTSQTRAFARDIAVDGEDVYVAGDGWNSSRIYVAYYWKNGVLTELSDGTYNTYTNGIELNYPE